MFVKVTTDGFSRRIPTQTHQVHAAITDETQVRTITIGPTTRLAVTVVQDDPSPDTSVTTRTAEVVFGGQELELLVAIAVANGVIKPPMADAFASLRSQLQTAIDLFDQAIPKPKPQLSARERREAAMKKLGPAKKAAKKAAPKRAKKAVPPNPYRKTP